MVLFRNRDFSYVKLLELDCGPTDDIQRLFIEICKKHDLRTKKLIGNDYVERWDFDKARIMFIGLFRKHKLRDCFLDKDRLEEEVVKLGL